MVPFHDELFGTEVQPGCRYRIFQLFFSLIMRGFDGKINHDRQGESAAFRMSEGPFPEIVLHLPGVLQYSMDTKQERASAVRNQMNRLVVEIAVSKAIKEISKGNMPRALRRLVEIGGLLAPADTPGELSSILQSMLGDDHHPYYTLARHIVDSVDKRYLMGFGINMGFECLSCGGETIRRQHALTGRWLPWMMGIHLPLLQPEMLRVPMSLGIMTYLLAAEKASAPELAALCRAFPNAAFLLALPDQNITSALLRELEGTVNLAVFPLCRHRAFASAPLLRNAGRFYIPFFLLDEADTDSLLPGCVIAAAAACWKQQISCVPMTRTFPVPCFFRIPACPGKKLTPSLP